MRFFLAFLFFYSCFTLAVINPTADTRTTDTDCISGLMAVGECPEGYALPPLGVSAYSYMLDTFEYTTETLPTYGSWTQETRYIWEVSEVDAGGDPRPQTLSIDQGAGLFGENSNAMRVDVTGSSTEAGGMFLRLYNNHNTNINDYWWVRDLTNVPELQRINRMRFWIKVPPEHPKIADNRNSFHVGTYQRLPTAPASEQESNGWHHYHYFNLEYTNSWTQIVVDTHPHHIRGGSGSTDQGIKTNMVSGYDYFDLWTYFYLALSDIGYTGHPATTLIDGIEFYEEPNAEDVENIYSISGTVDSSGQLIVKWSVHKDKVNELLDVKYSFTSFHENGGFSHGTYAPSGQNIDPIADFVPSGYNGVAYRTNAIDYGSNNAIYVAIKNQNEPALFREIRVPITLAGLPELPATTPDLTEPAS